MQGIGRTNLKKGKTQAKHMPAKGPGPPDDGCILRTLMRCRSGVAFGVGARLRPARTGAGAGTGTGHWSMGPCTEEPNLSMVQDGILGEIALLGYEESVAVPIQGQCEGASCHEDGPSHCAKGLLVRSTRCLQCPI